MKRQDDQSIKPRFQIVVEVFPNNHVPALRAIRELTGLGLKEAKALLLYIQSNYPCVLLAGVTKTVSENWANRLIRAGIAVQTQPSSISIPVLVAPNLDERYEYHWFFGLRDLDAAHKL